MAGHDYAVEKNILKNLTTKELVQVGNQIVKGKASDLQRYAKDPHATALQVMIASIVARVIRTGDMQSFSLLLDRLVGKVKDKVELSGEVLNPPQVVISLPANNRTSPQLLKNVTPHIGARYEPTDYIFE